MYDSKRRILVIVGVAISAVFLWFAVRDTDLIEIGRALRAADLRFAVPVLVTLGLFYWVKAVRWSLLLRPLRVASARSIFPAVMIGYASNLVLPAQLGEFVRMFVLGRRLELNHTAVLATIVLDRMFDFLTVLVLLGVALLMSPEPSSELLTAGYFVGGAGALLLVAAIAYYLFTKTVVRVVRVVLGFLPETIRVAIVEQVELGATGLEAIKNTRLVIGVTLMSLVQWALMGVCIYFSLVALSIDAPPSAGFVVAAFNVVGLSLPSSPGFFGTIQLSFVLALRPFGVVAGDAVAASIFWHVLAYASSAIVGLFFAVRLGISPAVIRRRTRDR